MYTSRARAGTSYLLSTCQFYLKDCLNFPLIVNTVLCHVTMFFFLFLTVPQNLEKGYDEQNKLHTLLDHTFGKKNVSRNNQVLPLKIFMSDLPLPSPVEGHRGSF